MNTFQKFYADNKEQPFGYLLRKTGSYSLAADIMQESFTRYLRNGTTAGSRVLPLLNTMTAGISAGLRRQDAEKIVDSLQARSRQLNSEQELCRLSGESMLLARGYDTAIERGMQANELARGNSMNQRGGSGDSGSSDASGGSGSSGGNGGGHR